MARVAVVGPFAVAPKGSIRYRALPIAAELARHGHVVRIFLPAWDNPPLAGVGFRWHGVSLEHYPAAGTSSYLRTLAEMTTAVLRWHPDVVYVFKPKGFSGAVQLFFYLVRAAGRYDGLIWLDRDDWEAGWNDRLAYPWWQKTLFRWQESWGSSHADLVTVASRWLLEHTDSHQVIHVPNGATHCWTNLARRPIPGLVLWYTRFTDTGMDFVLQVFSSIRREIPRAHLWVVGRGFAGEERGVAGVSGVRYLGWGTAALRRKALSLASAAIFPMDDDGVNRARCPVRLLEVMAAGVPVVASDVGETRRVLAGGNAGVLVPPGDAEAFARAVAWLLSDPTRAERLGVAARRHSTRKLPWRRVVAPLVEAADFQKSNDKLPWH